MTAHGSLALLLRFGGIVLVSAFGAMLLPVGWMASVHEWLGMGKFPEAPLTEYLIRSVAALYGFHGVLMLIVARDVVRYDAIVLYCGVMDVVFGSLMFAIDLGAGMPWWWTALEGPSLVGVGLLLLYLRNVTARGRPVRMDP